MRFAHYTICKEDESLPCGTWMAESTTFQDTLCPRCCQQRGEYYSVLFVSISIFCNRVLNSHCSEIETETHVLTLWSLLKLVWTWTKSTIRLTTNHFTGTGTTFYSTVSRFTITYWKKAQWNYDLKLNAKSFISLSSCYL